MSTETLNFSQVTSVKLPRSAAYIYNNLVEFNDTINNISYYGVINGFEVWIMKHSDTEKLNEYNNNKKEPRVELRKVAYDKLDYVSCIKWCKFGSKLTFIMATQNGFIHIYNFDAKKLLYSHQIKNQTINCIESNDKDLLFIGLSSGQLLSFNINQHKLSNKKLIYQCDNNEAINCISKKSDNNKIYFGCNDGSVIEYDYYLNNINILINKNNYDSCICISCCDEFIVTGYKSGHIKIIQKTIIKQIAMHRRMVTSVAILKDLSLIATVSEDGYYHIIKNISSSSSSSSSVELIRSGLFENTLLIGVKFIKSYQDGIILITGYDRHRIVFV